MNQLRQYQRELHSRQFDSTRAVSVMQLDYGGLEDAVT
jgi:hypothetical protein